MRAWLLSALLALPVGLLVGVGARLWEFGPLTAVGLIAVGGTLAGIPIVLEEVRRTGREAHRPR